MESLLECSGETVLDEGTLAANGASFVRREALEGQKPNDSIPDPAQLQVMEDSGLRGPAAEAEKIEEDAASAAGSHPMTDSSLPFSVRINVRKEGSKGEFKERSGRIVGNDYYVPLNDGEEYRIVLENKNDFPVWARVLVDGRSALAQRMTIVEKGAALETSREKDGEMVLAPRVALNDARAWYLEAKATNAIPGFAWPEKSETHPFIVTGSFDDISPSDSYADQLGWITVGFFKNVPKGGRGGDVATKVGPGVSKKFGYAEGKHPGELIAVYNIRYVSQKLLDELVSRELGEKTE